MLVRSSKHTLRFGNNNKIKQLEKLFTIYKESLQEYIDLIWEGELELKINLSSKDLPNISNGLKHSQWKQLIYKQASEIIRSNIKKKRTSKPDIQNIGINIDERLIDFSNDSKEFDEFVLLRLPFFKENKHRAESINLPIKHHKQSLKYKEWSRKNTIRLTKKNDQIFLWFTYEKEEPSIKTDGLVVAYDSGYKTLLASSKDELIGQNVENIYKKLANKKRGSKKYTRLLQHKRNEINRIINELDLININLVILENLKGIKNKSKFSKKFNNKLQYWSHAQVIEKFKHICEEQGIRLLKVSSAYTSQICSNCGNIDKKSRQGELYHCSACGFTLNADLNAAKNILHRGVYSPSNDTDADFL